LPEIGYHHRQSAGVFKHWEMPLMPRTQIVGIVNVTRDSFSDGGQCLEPDAAVAYAQRLVADGADVIDVGAESTHPDAEDVPADAEVARLTPVIERLKADRVRVSVDTYKPAVMRHALALGVDFINDITALRDPESVTVARDAEVKLIIMHSRASQARAERTEADPATIVDEIIQFFEQRVAALTDAGIARERLVIDPGMGFFLGSNPEASLVVLRDLRRLRALDLPILVSTSRKSFIGSVLGSVEEPRPVEQRAAGTLATEIWAAQHGVAYIRTHDVRALRDGLRMLAALRS
jgi:dihydropteroate synthase type 2